MINIDISKNSFCLVTIKAFHYEFIFDTSGVTTIVVISTPGLCHSKSEGITGGKLINIITRDFEINRE